MAEAESWFICRVGFVETIRAIGLAAGARATFATWDRRLHRAAGAEGLKLTPQGLP
jgi:hypothetical protein